MKQLHNDEWGVQTMLQNVPSVLSDIPAWRDAVIKLLEDWQTMYPLYHSTQIIERVLKGE